MPSLRAGVAIAAIIAAGCGRSPSAPSPAPVTIPLDSGAWQTISDPQPFPFPLANLGGLTFQIPSSGSINYLFTTSPLAALQGTLSITVAIDTSGTTVFESVDPQTPSCTIPPSVRPFLWANNNGNGEFDRWWSNPRAITLAAGTHTLSVPLTAEAWSSVNGKIGNADAPTRFAFDRALLNVSRLGVTFGGGCSFGHGIKLRSGNATFSLTDYSIR
jgi:hypothetical protein